MKTLKLEQLNRRTLRDGDLLLFRAEAYSPISTLIRVYGRGEHSHAAMVRWCRGRPLVLEAREFAGIRSVTLESQVARYPEAIEVYRPRCRDASAEAAADAFSLLLGQAYNYRGIWAAWLLRTPFVRLRVKADTRDNLERDEGPKYCSQAVSWAYRTGAGQDPVPNLADRFTEPADLARSRFFAPLFKLAP
jgi:uncharacterized protein YycO